MLEFLKRPLVMAILILLGLLGLVYWLRESLLPLLMAGVIAYIFMPWVNGLEKKGWKRSKAAAAVLGTLVLTTGLLFVLIMPQVAGLVADSGSLVLQGIRRLGKYYETYFDYIKYYFPLPGLPDPGTAGWEEKLRDLLLHEIQAHLQPLMAPTGKLLAGVGGLFGGLLGLLLELIFVPVFLYYLLCDGPGFLRDLKARVPAAASPKLNLLLATIDGAMRAYVLGAAKVIGVLIFVYAIAFLILQVPMALPLALFCALAHWVPYVGTAVSAGLCALLILIHAGADWRLAAVPLFIFAVHLTETLYITPRLVGKSVGLHPLMVLTALLLGVRFFGLGGLVLALPAAAILASLLPVLLPSQNLDKPLDKSLDKPPEIQT